MSQQQHSHVGFVWLVLAFAAAGCAKGKVAQCNRLIDVANAQESRLNTQMNQMNSTTGDPAQIDALASAFEQSRQQIAGVRVDDPQLLSLSREYQSVITHFVTVARGMASAARAQNVEGVNAAIPQLQEVENQSTAVVNRINVYCQSL